MEPEQYNNLLNYLNTLTLPEHFNNQQQKQFTNYSKQFIVKNNFIYKKDKRKDDNLLRVIRKHEIDSILYMMHNNLTAGYFAMDTMFEKIRLRYYWPQMYENIRTYVQSCDKC